MRAFCDLDLGRDPIPDETTILNFRHLLEAHELTKTVFEAVAEYLEARGALLRGGTIVDATLIAASPSTKNEAGKRDPHMHSSKKGNQWYFGMKAHVGVDAISGLVHTAGVTSGNVHDAKLMDRLIRDDDTAVYGDKGYASGAKKRAAEAAGVLWGGEGEGQTRTPADGSPACPQSPLRESLREGRTCVPCHEVPVRLPQGALSRPRQERRTGVLVAGARQPVSRPQDDCVRVT